MRRWVDRQRAGTSAGTSAGISRSWGTGRGTHKLILLLLGELDRHVLGVEGGGAGDRRERAGGAGEVALQCGEPALRHRQLVSSPATEPTDQSKTLNLICLDQFGSQIQGDLFGAAQWRIYQGAAKEFGFATSDSSP